MYRWKRGYVWSPRNFRGVLRTGETSLHGYGYYYYRMQMTASTMYGCNILLKRRLLIEFNRSRVLHVFFYGGRSLLFFTLLPLESMDDSLCLKSFGQFGHFLGLTRTSKKQVYNIIHISYHWYQWDPIFMTFWLIRVIRCDQSKNLNISKYEWTENVYNSSRMWNWIWFQMFRR